MTMVQAVILVIGALMLVVPLCGWMARANREERDHIERRRREWIANGRIPEDEPRFFSGDSSGGYGG